MVTGALLLVACGSDGDRDELETRIAELEAQLASQQEAQGTPTSSTFESSGPETPTSSDRTTPPVREESTTTATVMPTATGHATAVETPAPTGTSANNAATPSATAPPVPGTPTAPPSLEPQVTQSPAQPTRQEVVVLNRCLELWGAMSTYEGLATLERQAGGGGSNYGPLIEGLQTEADSTNCAGVGARAGYEPGAGSDCAAVRQDVANWSALQTIERQTGIHGVGSSAIIGELNAYLAAAKC